MTKYTLNKSFTMRSERTERVLLIAESFGLGLEEKQFHVLKNVELTVNQGDVVYINGQSGSGKSQLLRVLRDEMIKEGLKVADIDEVKLEDKALIDQIGSTMNESIELLARAGLNDAYLLVRKPSELSDGQKYRLRMAKLFSSEADVIVADEFGAVLDRETAKAVAFNAQKWARSMKKTLIVATTHTDLVDELGPSVTITKRFNDRISIKENAHV